MIRILKPTTIPVILTTKGGPADKRNQKKYSLKPKAYISGKATISINKEIYGDKTVKNTLKIAQHKKCCYCEKDQTDEYGAVEHFRPKEGYRSKKGEKIKKPGYYWLGYSWSNLYFICTRCNISKGTFFPIVKESTRAKYHKHDISKESSYIIDPSGKKNPRSHIIFDFEFIKGKTNFGKKTIEICRLDRSELNDKRKEVIDNIKIRIVILAKRKHYTLKEIGKAKKFIQDSVSPKSKFSAVAIDFLKTKPTFLKRNGITIT